MEKNTDIRIKCYKCGSEYAMDMMRMDPNGKNLVCKLCLNRTPVPKDAKKAEAKQMANPNQNKLSHPTSDYKEYFCKECRYNFKRAKHISVTSCPYCNSEGTVVTKGSTARIIADASKMK